MSELSGEGVWCIIQLGYDHSDGARTRWLIETLKPIQVSGVDLDDYREKRTAFTTDEWLDLLVQSIGLDPAYFNRRGKLIQISRLITHVENNYNFVELGPKGTGKSHIFSELSPHGVLVSGGDVTSARLFVSNSGKGKVGLVGYWDAGREVLGGFGVAGREVLGFGVAGRQVQLVQRHHFSWQCALSLSA